MFRLDGASFRLLDCESLEPNPIRYDVFKRLTLLSKRCTKQRAMGFRPKASEVLSAYLRQVNEPPWTSYFVKYSSVVNDQFAKSHFNWQVGRSNYHILRTGCFPYIKYHCSKRPFQDLSFEDTCMGVIKLMNLGT
ncbi:hypothetical protein GE061_018765 [Apolygus lucorum]|uniref:Uncharacterized protein n=1 Tax=Apolygus lucorum TaxID=248454 RepID=A0A6A4JND5_APOLU|nr:hypothetical protein GE061_018765 [Apolygus lucorum]